MLLFRMHIFEQDSLFYEGNLFQEESYIMKYLDCVALSIAIIGAVNWGLIGLFGFNLVAALFGSMTLVSRIVYGLVGLCGLYLLKFYGYCSMDE